MRIVQTIVASIVTVASLMSVSGEHSIWASTHTSPRLLVLRTTDVPSGFRRQQAGFVNNAQAARQERIDRSVLNRKGRVTGYATSLVKVVNGAGVATIIVDGTALYKTPAGARWEVAHLAQAIRRDAGERRQHLQKLSLGDLGQAQFGVVRRTPAGKQTISVFSILFQRRAYAVSLEVTDITGIGQDQVVRWARIIDHRLQRAS